MGLGRDASEEQGREEAGGEEGREGREGRVGWHLILMFSTRPPFCRERDGQQNNQKGSAGQSLGVTMCRRRKRWTVKTGCLNINGYQGVRDSAHSDSSRTPLLQTTGRIRKPGRVLHRKTDANGYRYAFTHTHTHTHTQTHTQTHTLAFHTDMH